MSDKENDLLDSLMESLSEDQEIEQKIDAFARNKERSLRIARARQTSEQFQHTYASKTDGKTEPPASENQTPEAEQPQDVEKTAVIMNSPAQPDDQGGTIRVQPEELNPDQQAEGSSTRVFSGVPAQEETSEGGSTVSVSDSEIQSLLEKDTPILSRQYIDDSGEEEEPEEDYRPPKVRKSPKKKQNNWKLPAIIAGAVALAALAGGGGYLIWRAVSAPSSQTQSANFDKLMNWVNGYLDLSEDDQKKITDYKKMYDRLSEDEKRKVNEALMASTGKTFDELLAAAAEQDKPQSSNQNMANAERKAQLKQQMKTLEQEISQLNSQLTSSQQRISAAQDDYNSKNAAYSSAQAAADTAQSTFDSLNNQIAGLKAENDSLYAQISQLQQTPPDDDDDDDSQSGNHGNKEDNADKIRALQQQIDSNNSKINSLQGELNTAQSNLSTASQNASSAKQAADTAYGAWQAILGETDPISQQIAQKNDQLAALQQEYNSID